MAIKEITKRLQPEFDFYLLTYRFSASEPRFELIDGVKVFRLGFGTLFDRLFLFPLLAFWKGRQLVRREKISVLWGVMVSYASIAAYLLRLLNSRLYFFLTLQEGDSEAHLKFGKAGLLGFWWRRLVKKADYLQVISTFLGDYAIQQGASKRIAVIPNGVDIEHFSTPSTSATLQRYRRFFSLGPEDKVIITVSRLVEKNGVEVIISALSFLGKNYKLLILGQGRLEAKLKKIVAEKKLEDRVIFVGTVSHKELPDYLHLADVFVRPSRSEGLGTAFLEAMAAKVPVIGTAVGGIPDFLRDRHTGLVVKIDDSPGLAEKIKEITTNRELSDKLKERAFKLVQERYSWDQIAAELGKVLTLPFSSATSKE